MRVDEAVAEVGPANAARPIQIDAGHDEQAHGQMLHTASLLGNTTQARPGKPQGVGSAQF